MSCPYTIEDVIEWKTYSLHQLKKDFQNLNDFKADNNPRKHCGNKIIYHYQIKHLLNCRRGTKGYHTLPEMLEDPILSTKIWEETCQRNRRDVEIPSPIDLYECHRINKGAIVAFKAPTAKYLYKRFKAKHILDPTAGWGGRLLAAANLGIQYTGIDTNTNLKEGYDNMIKDLNLNNVKMIWENTLNVDYKSIGADMVMTSPPYSNMEIYENMDGWKDDHDFYENFMIPLLKKLDEETHCKIYAINVSPKMYKELITKYNVRKANDQIDMRQQLGQQYKTKSQDYTYIWYGYKKMVKGQGGKHCEWKRAKETPQ